MVKKEKVTNPFYDNCQEYINTYVMPEGIAFYISNSYSRNAMWVVGVKKIIFWNYLPSGGPLLFRILRVRIVAE